MTTALDAAQHRSTPAEQRYRAAEAALWGAYGLSPIEHWVQLPDLSTTIRVIEIGSGSPLLFVPGTGGTGPYWAPLVRELQDHRCLLLDRPGWGLSEPIAYRSAEYARVGATVVSAVLDQFRIDRTDFVGASIGAIWALRSAQLIPARVDRVVLIGAFPNREVEIPRFVKLLRSPIGALIVRIPLRPRMLRQQLRAIGHGPTIESGAMDDFMEWRLSFGRDTPSMRHERAMVQAMVGPDGFRPGITLSDEDLAAIEQPTLMVFGTADPAGSPEIWRRFTDSMPNGQLRLIPDAGHMAWWDQPSEVARHVRDFLADGAPKAAG